jgi:signal transduction histidine kinase
MTNRLHPNELDAVRETLRAMATSVMYAVEGETIDHVFTRIAVATRDLVQARYAALGIPDGKGGMLHFNVSGLTQEAIDRIGPPPVGRGLLGVIMNERVTLRLTDMSSDPRHVGFPPNHPHMTRLLGVPIQLGDRLYGMLYLTDRLDGQPFDEYDQSLVETMAGYAALAIAGIELRDMARRLTLLEERERIAMDLHDSALQTLYGVGMQLQVLRLMHEPLAADLTEAIRSLDSVVDDIRRAIHNLKDNAPRRTVAQRIRHVLRRLHIPSGIDITINAGEIIAPLPPEVLDDAMQVIQEAMSNAIRHAGPTKIVVTAKLQDDQFLFIVNDDGAGFHEQDIEPGFGLENMRSRARLTGGKLNIEANRAGGTSVCLAVPITD